MTSPTAYALGFLTLPALLAAAAFAAFLWRIPGPWFPRLALAIQRKVAS